MKYKKSLSALFASALAFGSLQAADINVPRNITRDTTWTADNTYFLTAYTFVQNGATLTIEPGTVVKGRTSSGANAAALIVQRGSKLNAVGTPDRPIIFTSELDNLNGNLDANDTGLWGGIIVLGRATINSRANGQPASVTRDGVTFNEDQVEGVSVTGAEEGFGSFGGTNDADNSGTMRYISLRHGGAVVGADNEINGFTLGGVGTGTVMEYLEVYANKDDSFEWFGGTVNARYLVSAFGNDDQFDMDQGYRGNLQFLFSIQTDIGADRGDKALEWDGATSPLDATPKGATTVANYTAIGIGTSGQGRANTAINVRDNVTVRIYNSIFVNFEKMLDIENDIGTPVPDIKGNLFWSHIAANNTPAGLNARPTGNIDISAYFSNAANNNQIVNPNLRSIGYLPRTGALDPRPAVGSAALTGTLQTVSGSGLVASTFRGAFPATGSMWTTGWTKLSEDGYFATEVGDTGGGSGTITVNRASPSKLRNIATRGFVGTGGQSLIGGFVVAGPQTQSVLIRAVGPTLTGFGVTGALANPVVELFRSNADGTSTSLATNTVWSGAQVTSLSAEVGAFALNAGSNDAVILATLTPGNYTAVVTGAGGTTGVALLEVYEVD
jgi:hypothetical protein